MSDSRNKLLSAPSKKQMKTVWEIYSGSQETGEAPDETKRFFSALPSEIKRNFFLSSNRVIQFGLASGRFLHKTNTAKNRECIGYDYTEASSSRVKKAGIQHRKVNLNRVNDKGTLSCQDKLEKDLSVPCDILIIRLLEYLDESAALLLIASLIETAKPGSVFYINMNTHESSPIVNRLSTNDVFTLFAGREDVECIHNETVPQFGCESQHGLDGSLVALKK